MRTHDRPSLQRLDPKRHFNPLWGTPWATFGQSTSSEPSRQSGRLSQTELFGTQLWWFLQRKSPTKHTVHLVCTVKFIHQKKHWLNIWGLLLKRHLSAQSCSSKPSGQSLMPSQNWLWEMQMYALKEGQRTEGLRQADRVKGGALVTGSFLFGFVELVGSWVVSWNKAEKIYLEL